MQCKDISDLAVLTFLANLPPWEDGTPREWGTWFWSDTYRPCNSIGNAAPDGTPEKVLLAKGRILIKRGLIDGCACGCRGDFELTDKGREFLQLQT